MQSDERVPLRISGSHASCEVWGMRKGIVVDVTTADRALLEAVVANRNSPQKHVCGPASFC